MQKDVDIAMGKVRVHGWTHIRARADGECRVIDGDTLVIGGQRMRLYGYDAPAINGHSARGAPHCAEEHEKGLLAKHRLEQLMRWGAANGDLRIDILDRKDRYNRPLIVLHACGLAIGALMAADGLAADFDEGWPKPPFCSCPSRLAAFEAATADWERKHGLTRSQRRFEAQLAEARVLAAITAAESA